MNELTCAVEGRRAPSLNLISLSYCLHLMPPPQSASSTSSRHWPAICVPEKGQPSRLRCYFKMVLDRKCLPADLSSKTLIPDHYSKPQWPAGRTAAAQARAQSQSLLGSHSAAPVP